MPAPTSDWKAYVAAALAEGEAKAVGVNDEAFRQAVTTFIPSGTLKIGMPPPPPEGCDEDTFTSHVRRAAMAGGWDYYHTFRSKRSDAGFPDVVACRSGSLVAAELKVKKNKPTAAQKRWLEALRKCGARTFVWYPTDWEKIVEVFK